MNGKVIQITVAGSPEVGDSLYALTDAGIIYEQIRNGWVEVNLNITTR